MNLISALNALKKKYPGNSVWWLFCEKYGELVSGKDWTQFEQIEDYFKLNVARGQSWIYFDCPNRYKLTAEEIFSIIEKNKKPT